MQASPCLLCFEVFHYGEGLPLLSIFASFSLYLRSIPAEEKRKNIPRSVSCSGEEMETTSHYLMYCKHSYIDNIILFTVFTVYFLLSCFYNIIRSCRHLSISSMKEESVHRRRRISTRPRRSRQFEESVQKGEPCSLPLSP